MVYLPGDREGALLVRSQADVRQVSAAIRSAVAAAGAGQVEDIRTLDSVVEGTIGRERLVAALSTVFGALATLLAAIGLYGVLAYGVSRRTAELGIRMALGAQRRNVQWMVLRESLQMAAAGTGVGLAAAYAATRLVSSMLYGVKPTDGLIFAGSALVLAFVTALAGFLPARRASRIDPMVALRYE